MSEDKKEEMRKLALKRMEQDKLRELSESRPYVLQVIQTQILYDIAGMMDELSGKIDNFHREWGET